MKIFYALFLVFLLMSTASAAGCICTADYTPVCATNGKTYGNICRLRCSGAKVKHEGHC
ncbi:leech-derived tryptase inhibitor C-like [Ostrinia furnacalis]|uniref:leech-derived tryptase inhibitor C-like n=1 Tax=Ostrinia furnacalis TaxID=93504 RepID=UPI00103CAACD|nr:leech-derived tryptase inhibitor C-like [Ostrinia furnacalis]